MKALLAPLGGTVSAFVVCALASKGLAFLLKRKKAFVPVKPELPVQDGRKSRTPGFGGVAIVAAVSLSAALFADPSDPSAGIPLAAMWIFALVGLADDLLKLRSDNGDGLSVGQKLVCQIVGAFLVVAMVVWNDGALRRGGAGRAVPHAALAALFLVYITNGYNITDGVDGLAATSLLPVLAVLGVLGRTSSLFTLVLILAGAICGFLLLNRSPAKIFMGDTGSHAIAALVGASALMLKSELLVLLAGFLFTVELFSSLAQIVSIRVFRRKLFEIAPLHHILEKKGCAAARIVSLFSLVNVAGAGAALLIWSAL